MSSLELVRGLEALLEKGFDDSFAVFCAAEFSSHWYPPAGLAPARMHAFHLRIAIQELTVAAPRERVPVAGSNAGDMITEGKILHTDVADPAACIVEETRSMSDTMGPEGGTTAKVRREIASRCFASTLCGGGGAESFCRRFVRSWCMYFSREETGHQPH